MFDPRQASELQIHFAVADLLRFKASVLWFHPANGEGRDKRTAAKLKHMGVIPGVADFVLFLPGGRAACLEIKTDKGRQSPEQRAFEAQCEALGVPYAVARSLDEAEAILERWGALRSRHDEWEHISEPVGRVVERLAVNLKRNAA